MSAFFAKSRGDENIHSIKDNILKDLSQLDGFEWARGNMANLPGELNNIFKDLLKVDDGEGVQKLTEDQKRQIERIFREEREKQEKLFNEDRLRNENYLDDFDNDEMNENDYYNQQDLLNIPKEVIESGERFIQHRYPDCRVRGPTGLTVLFQQQFQGITEKVLRLTEVFSPKDEDPFRQVLEAYNRRLMPLLHSTLDERGMEMRRRQIKSEMKAAREKLRADLHKTIKLSQAQEKNFNYFYSKRLNQEQAKQVLLNRYSNTNHIERIGQQNDFDVKKAEERRQKKLKCALLGVRASPFTEIIRTEALPESKLKSLIENENKHSSEITAAESQSEMDLSESEVFKEVEKNIHDVKLLTKKVNNSQIDLGQESRLLQEKLISLKRRKNDDDSWNQENQSILLESLSKKERLLLKYSFLQSHHERMKQKYPQLPLYILNKTEQRCCEFLSTLDFESGLYSCNGKPSLQKSLILSNQQQQIDLQINGFQGLPNNFQQNNNQRIQVNDYNFERYKNQFGSVNGNIFNNQNQTNFVQQTGSINNTQQIALKNTVFSGFSAPDQTQQQENQTNSCIQNNQQLQSTVQFQNTNQNIQIRTVDELPNSSSENSSDSDSDSSDSFRRDRIKTKKVVPLKQVIQTQITQVSIVKPIINEPQIEKTVLTQDSPDIIFLQQAINKEFINPEQQKDQTLKQSHYLREAIQNSKFKSLASSFGTQIERKKLWGELLDCSSQSQIDKDSKQYHLLEQPIKPKKFRITYIQDQQSEEDTRLNEKQEEINLQTKYGSLNLSGAITNNLKVDDLNEYEFVQRQRAYLYDTGLIKASNQLKAFSNQVGFKGLTISNFQNTIPQNQNNNSLNLNPLNLLLKKQTAVKGIQATQNSISQSKTSLENQIIQLEQNPQMQIMFKTIQADHQNQDENILENIQTLQSQLIETKRTKQNKMIGDTLKSSGSINFDKLTEQSRVRKLEQLIFRINEENKRNQLNDKKIQNTAYRPTNFSRSHHQNIQQKTEENNEVVQSSKEKEQANIENRKQKKKFCEVEEIEEGEEDIIQSETAQESGESEHDREMEQKQDQEEEQVSVHKISSQALLEKSKKKKKKLVRKIKRKTLKMRKRTEKEDSSIASSHENEDMELQGNLSDQIVESPHSVVSSSSDLSDNQNEKKEILFTKQLEVKIEDTPDDHLSDFSNDSQLFGDDVPDFIPKSNQPASHARCILNLHYTKFKQNMDDCDGFLRFHRPDIQKLFDYEKDLLQNSLEEQRVNEIMKGQGPETNLMIDHMGNIKMIPSEARESKLDFVPIQLPIQIIDRETIKAKNPKQTRINADEYFKERVKLSLRDGKFCLFEHIDEEPLYINNFGMASQLQRYLYSDTQIPKKEFLFGSQNYKLKHMGPFGQQILKNKNSKLPLLGSIDKEKFQGIAELSNKLYRAPVFFHKNQHQDFFCSHFVDKRGNKQIVLREIQGVYTVGQIEPKEAVYDPQSRKYHQYIKERSKAYILRFMQENNYEVYFRDIQKLFFYLNDQTLKKFIKEMDVTVEKDCIRMSPKSDLDVKALVTPEMICQYESALYGEVMLRIRGIQEITKADKISYASNKYCSEQRDPRRRKIAKFIENQVLCTPWNLSQNFTTIQNNGMLMIRGVGDPSNGHGGYSFLKMPLKMSHDSPMDCIKMRQDINPAIQNPKSVTGTTADLRKLKKDDTKEKLIKEMGVDPKEIEHAARWEIIGMLRENASKQQGTDQDRNQQYARGIRFNSKRQREEYHRRVNELFYTQMVYLTGQKGLDNKSDYEGDLEIDNQEKPSQDNTDQKLSAKEGDKFIGNETTPQGSQNEPLPIGKFVIEIHNQKDIQDICQETSPDFGGSYIDSTPIQHGQKSVSCGKIKKLQDIPNYKRLLLSHIPNQTQQAQTPGQQSMIRFGGNSGAQNGDGANNQKNQENILNEKLEKGEMTLQCKVLKKVIKNEMDTSLIERIEFSSELRVIKKFKKRQELCRNKIRRSKKTGLREKMHQKYIQQVQQTTVGSGKQSKQNFIGFKQGSDSISLKGDTEPIGVSQWNLSSSLPIKANTIMNFSQPSLVDPNNFQSLISLANQPNATQIDFQLASYAQDSNLVQNEKRKDDETASTLNNSRSRSQNLSTSINFQNVGKKDPHQKSSFNFIDSNQAIITNFQDPQNNQAQIQQWAKQTISPKSTQIIFQGAKQDQEEIEVNKTDFDMNGLNMDVMNELIKMVQQQADNQQLNMIQTQIDQDQQGQNEQMQDQAKDIEMNEDIETQQKEDRSLNENTQQTKKVHKVTNVDQISQQKNFQKSKSRQSMRAIPNTSGNTMSIYYEGPDSSILTSTETGFRKNQSTTNRRANLKGETILNQQFTQVVEACIDYDGNNHIFQGIFRMPVSKRDAPNYYDIIQKPICLDQIKQKSRRQEYRSVESFLEDFKQMRINCEIFNGVGSQLSELARLIEEMAAKKLVETDVQEKIQDALVKIQFQDA